MPKITNRDIALRAGVSPAAVSMAIHGRKGVSEATRAHILNIVREMNYTPPARAHSVRLKTIVLLIGDPAEPLLPPVMKALLRLAQENGSELRVLPQHQLLENPAELLSSCSLLVTFDGLERSVLDELAPLVPQVLIVDGNFSRKPFWNVRIDYSGAVYALTRRLAEMGHRSFIYLNADLQASKNLFCFSGFQKLILEMHLPLNPAQIIMDLQRDPHIWSHIPDIIRDFNISAIICTSDRAAVEVVNRLRAFDIRVPEDVSVAAVSDGVCPEHPNFSFTHVGLNYTAIEEELRRLIVHTVPSDEHVDVLIPYNPVRDGISTAAPKFNPAQKKLVIMLYLKNHPSLRIVRAGFLDMIQQMGYQAEVAGIESDDYNEYFRAMRELANEKIDGLISWLAEPGAFDCFTQRGIPVVTLHGVTREMEGFGEQARIAEDPAKIAAEVAQFFTARLRDRAGVLAVSQSSDNMLESSITRELIAQMREKCPNVTVRNEFDFVQTDRTDMLTEYIRNMPDLVGAFTTAGFSCVNWAAAIRASGRKDLVLVGTDYSDESIRLVEQGELDAFVAQPLYEEGQMGVVAMDAILRGNQFPCFRSLDAPLVTRENLEKYRRLLQEVNNWYA